jgi:hypothetical protein
MAIGGHHSARAGTDEWLTPRRLVRILGPFDLDPCAAPEPRPWPTALAHYTRADNGLTRPWRGHVWLNPPYGGEVGAWLDRLADHGDGLALVFARTETTAWQRHVWPRADAVLFLAGRLTFHHADGRLAPHNAGGPSALIAYGSRAYHTLIEAHKAHSRGYLAGAFVFGWLHPDHQLDRLA